MYLLMMLFLVVVNSILFYQTQNAFQAFGLGFSIGLLFAAFVDEL